jgi:hypothetical protein
VTKLSQVIFFSTFGVWMARKRREAAWKSRDKESSKNRALSRHGRSAEQKADGEAQPALRRSARILERKIRAQEPDHAGRSPDGKEDRNQLKPRGHGMLLDYSGTQRACVSGPLDTQPIPATRMDSRSPHLSSVSTPRHLSVPAAVGYQGSVQIHSLSSSGGPGSNRTSLL